MLTIYNPYPLLILQMNHIADLHVIGQTFARLKQSLISRNQTRLNFLNFTYAWLCDYEKKESF